MKERLPESSDHSPPVEQLFNGSRKMSMLAEPQEVYERFGYIFDYLTDNKVKGALCIIVYKPGKVLRVEAAYSEP